MKERIYLIFEDLNKARKDELNEIVNEVVNRRPLSKYGIFPQIEIRKESELNEIQKDETIKNKTKFYLYGRGKTYKFEDNKVFEKWINLIKDDIWNSYKVDEIPPILSAIMINQDIPKQISNKSSTQMSLNYNQGK